MTDLLVILPLLVPLTAAALCGLFWLRPSAQRVVTVIGMAALLASAIALVLAVRENGIMATQPGAWAAPFGISIVADPLSVLLVLAACILAMAVAVFSFRDVGMNELRGGFFPLFNGLVLGVNGSFLTGDVFNMYVWFEVMLVCAVGLLVVRRGGVNLDGAVKYAALNLFGTILFLMGVAFIYGAAGTLNIADLAVILPELGQTTGITVALVFFLLALAVKAGLFPLFFWLPISYHTPPAAISAIFAGLLTKVGIYAAIRIVTLVFGAQAADLTTALTIVAALTMLIGALCAAAQSDIRRMLVFLIMSGMGYLLMGIAIGTTEAVSASVFYLFHDIVVKGAMFLLAGAVFFAGGTYDLRQSGGLVRSHPVLAGVFILAGLSLAGLPLFSGFWAKVLIVGAAMDGASYWLAAAALVAGFLNLYCVAKIWMEAFWKAAPEGVDIAARPKLPLVVMAPVTGLVLVSTAIGLWPQPLIETADAAGEILMNPPLYSEGVIQAVIEGTEDVTDPVVEEGEQ
jgi:multicomponent Na+:H+ antiporter subunit D